MVFVRPIFQNLLAGAGCIEAMAERTTVCRRHFCRRMASPSFWGNVNLSPEMALWMLPLIDPLPRIFMADIGVCGRCIAVCHASMILVNRIPIAVLDIDFENHRMQLTLEIVHE